jgi:hypothetical protein
MGFFKSINEAKKMGQEMQKNMDVRQTMADAQSRMAAANEMMAQQTAAANVAATGVTASASIVAVRDAGAMVNMQPMCEIDLTVMPDGLPPYPVTVKQVVAATQLALLTPGKTVEVKVDPNNPATVFINLATLV